MKKAIGLSAIIIFNAVFFGGCGASTGLIVDHNSHKIEKRCASLDKDLIKVDKYIELVNNTDAFHMEELAQAVQYPDITVSTNKKRMLKDANALRDHLDEERKSLNCR